MFLRARSISEVVDIVVTCVNCDQKYDSSFSIENISVEKAENQLRPRAKKLSEKLKLQDATEALEEEAVPATKKETTKKKTTRKKKAEIEIIDEV